MLPIPRRRFVGSIAALASGPLLPACRRSDRRPALDPDALSALAEVLLPSELGPDGRARVLADFGGWIAGYHPGAEMLHGYGTASIEYAGEHPVERWSAQLDALSRDAGQALATLSLDARRAIVRRALNGVPTGRLPTPERAEHIAVGLIAFFYASPEAANLCYRARIDPFGCRSLDSVTDAPSSL